MPAEPVNPARLVNATQLSRRLRVRVAWLKAEAAAGRLPCLDAGGTLLFDSLQVEQVLLARASGADWRTLLDNLPLEDAKPKGGTDATR